VWFTGFYLLGVFCYLYRDIKVCCMVVGSGIIIWQIYYGSYKCNNYNKIYIPNSLNVHNEVINNNCNNNRVNDNKLIYNGLFLNKNMLIFIIPLILGYFTCYIHSTKSQEVNIYNSRDYNYDILNKNNIDNSFDVIGVIERIEEKENTYGVTLNLCVVYEKDNIDGSNLYLYENIENKYK